MVVRRTGIRVYLRLKSKEHTRSFLTLLATYYRLAEKWTFPICDDIKFPDLDFLSSVNVHGPVTFEFVKAKFQASQRTFPDSVAGSYLIRQCDKLPYRQEVENFRKIPTVLVC